MMISNKRKNPELAKRKPRRKHAKLDRKKSLEIEEKVGEEKGVEEVDEEEVELESFLFGRISEGVVADDEEAKMFLRGEDENEDEDEDGDGDLLSFEISRKPGDVVDFHIDTKGSNAGGGQVENVPIQLGEKKSQPAWVDPDDEQVTVNIKNTKSLRKLRVDDVERDVSGTKFQERLKSNFEKVLPAPAWADITKAKNTGEEEEEERLMKSGAKLLSSRPDSLPKGVINIKRLKDLNIQKPSNATITNLKFHPTAKIALTASLNKNLNIFQVDGKENEKLQSIFLNNFPIWCADFTPAGDKVICSSRRKHFYVYDMIAGSVMKIPKIRGRYEKSLEKFVLSPDGEMIAFMGESGYVNLVSMKTMHWIASVKMNGRAHTAHFSADSSKLYTTGREGEMYVWDVASRRCLHRFIDDGSLLTTTIGVSNSNDYVALGSSSGVVNIYDDSCFRVNTPTPVRTIMNLTTQVEGTVFNPTSEILACFSPQSRNALKLVHFPSLTTFSNWPMEKLTLGNIKCLDFSPKSGYLSVGNEAGKALLFRLNHYPDS